MTAIPFLLALCATAAAGAPASPIPAPGAATAAVQDEKPDKRPEVKALLERLKAHVKERGDEDEEAVQVIDLLLQEFPESGKKDRADIVKGLDKNFDAKRQETEEGNPDNKLYIASAVALGEMGPESTKVLAGWIDHKSHRKDLALQRHLILALGKTADEKAIKPLVNLLPHRQAQMQGAAAEALANFTHLPSKERKDIFEAVLKVVTAAKNLTKADVNDIIARERYDVIAAPMITTLQELAGHDERDPDEWQRWWNKNKKDDWDEES